MHKELTGKIIGAAIEVHKMIGPGFIESVYENALVIELSQRRIQFSRQFSIPVHYHGVEVGIHRLDLFVATQIVVELKAVKEITDIHFIIVRSYLKAVNRTHGLILNFAKAKLEVKRVQSRTQQ